MRLLALVFALGSMLPRPSWSAESKQGSGATQPEASPSSEPEPEAESSQAKRRRRRAASPESFRDGLSAYYDDDFKRAAARMYDYIATNPETVENRAWAKYFLGVALARLDFRQAAAEHLFDVANDRTRPEILPDALTELEALMDGPHDEQLIERRLLIDSDFGYLPSSVAGFVLYHQGLADLRSNRRTWAERLFRGIPRDTTYDARALYALGVDHLRRQNDLEAVRGFRAALAHPDAPREVRNRARLALARVLYRKKRYEAADAMYRRVEVPPLTPAEGEILLERAWTAYWRGANRDAMGLLYALEAPSYRDLHAPEKFLLRALIYKKLCHYIPAKREIRRFRLSFGGTLDAIRRRIDLREDPILRKAALAEDAPLGRLMSFRRLLARESRRVDDVGGEWAQTRLDESLRTIYRLAATRSDLHIDTALAEATRRVAEDLVAFEEQMYLLDYEVGLAIYRRLKEEQARRGVDAPVEIPLIGDEAVYPFVGEFWNDELSNFDFLIENRCFDEGGDE